MASRTLRKEYRAAFRNLERNGVATALAILAGYAGSILLAIVLGAWAIADAGAWAYAIVPALMVFIGTRLRGLNNIVHECTHFAFVEGNVLNDLFGKMAAVPVLAAFTQYRAEHATHHTYLGDSELDEDLRELLVFGLDKPVDKKMLLRHIATPLLGLHLRRYLSPDLSMQDGTAFGLAKRALMACVAAAFVVFPLTTLLLVVLPYVWVFTGLNYWADCIDHAGRLNAEDELYKSRNFIVSPPLRMLFFPRGDCYHLIHHLFPSVPVHHFPACHAQLMANSAYRTLSHYPALPPSVASPARAELST